MINYRYVYINNNNVLVVGYKYKKEYIINDNIKEKLYDLYPNRFLSFFDSKKWSKYEFKKYTDKKLKICSLLDYIKDDVDNLTLNKIWLFCDKEF